MQKSVPNAPTHEEFFGLDDNILTDRDFDADSDDDKIKKMLIIMLGLMEEFYILHMYDEAYYFASEQFKEDMDNFNAELKDNLLVLFSSFMVDLALEYDVKYGIPSDLVQFQIELEELINSGIDAVTMTLYYDLKDKADFYTELSMTTGSFSPHSNFRRAIKRLANQVDYKGHHIQKIIDRKYNEFVYGQDALFTWHCTGINTCAWCYEIESKGAMPLSWFPLDHINGRCWLEPVNPDKFSDEYMRLKK